MYAILSSRPPTLPLYTTQFKNASLSSPAVGEFWFTYYYKQDPCTNTRHTPSGNVMAASNSSSESRFICFDFFQQHYLQGNANGFNSTLYITSILNLWLAYPNHYHPSRGGAYLHRHPYTTPSHPQPTALGSSPTITHIHSHRVKTATGLKQTKGKDGRSLKLLGVSPKSKVTCRAQAGI
jgi:hypothetical protein